MNVKALFAVFALLCATIGAWAQEISGYPIGYCNGQMAKSAVVKYNVKTVTLSTALHIPATYARTVADNRLESIRVALCSTHNVDSLRVWVRATPDGPDLAVGYAEKPVQGWNNITLDTPYYIPADTEGFYMGYSYYQKAKSGAISSLPEGREGSLWVQCGLDGEWTDRSAEGTLCIEGMVFGDNLPRLNVQLLGVSTDRVFIISDGNLNCVADVRNIATQTVTGFDIEAEIEGVAGTCTAHVDCDLPYGTTKRLAFVLNPDITDASYEAVNAKFTITKLDEGMDEDPTDNSASASFRVLANAYPRTVLVEEFTTENCPNCPRVGGYIHNLVNNPDYADRFAAICHHSGYGTDFLTTPFDIEYEWFYNDGGATYAPGTMVDRCLYEDNSAVFCPQSEEELAQAISDRLAEPSLVSVTPQVLHTMGGGNIMRSVMVNGSRCQDDVLADARITVFLVENNVKALSQAAGGVDYVHQHVNRAVNATWGEPIEWNGNDFTYTCTFEIDESWETGYMEVVAVVGNYNPDDATDCMVYNVGTCEFGKVGISDVDADGTREIEGIYTPAGVRVSAPVQGVNIIRYTDGSVRRVFNR